MTKKLADTTSLSSVKEMADLAAEKLLAAARAEEIGPFAALVLSDKGGVGKSATAVMIWALLCELGLIPRIGEAESGTTQMRKMSLVHELVEGIDPIDPSVTVPSPGEVADNPDLAVRTFARILDALTDMENATVIDAGSSVSKGLLEAIDAADHGEMTDGGRHLRIVIVAKATDMSSAEAAEIHLSRTRKMYPNATIVLVITHVTHDREFGTHNATAVVDAAQRQGKASSVVLIPLLSGMYMDELYGEQHISFFKLARMAPESILEISPNRTLTQVRIYRGKYITWYNQVLSALAAALKLPAPPTRTKTGAAGDPVKVGGADPLDGERAGSTG